MIADIFLAHSINLKGLRIFYAYHVILGDDPVKNAVKNKDSFEDSMI